MTCKIEGCPNPVYGHGLCAKHYFRQRRHGDAAVTHKPGPKPSKPKPQPKIGVVEDAEVGKLRAENERLCEEKRRALAIADERSKENVELRDQIKRLRNASTQEQARPRAATAQNADEHENLYAEIERLSEAKSKVIVDLRNEIKRLGNHIAEGLSATAKQRLDAAIRAKIKEIEHGYNTRRMDEIGAHLKRIFPDLQKRQNDAFKREEVYRKYMAEAKKAFTPDQFKMILSCLHPDSRKSTSERKLGEAFRLFSAKRFGLTGETPPKKGAK